MQEDPKTLLVIDDDTQVRESIAAYLEDSGYIVVQAGSAGEGLERYRSEKPDVVLCDLRIPPAEDGGDVLRNIAADASRTPIIVTSGLGVMSDVVDALRLGASDYIIKPIVDMQVLDYAVGRCLEQARLRRENRKYRQQLEKANEELTEHLVALERDQQAGRHIQMKMLPPRHMESGAYDFAQRVFPSLYLSGDFLDYTVVGSDHVVFLVADVSGHGVSSAFVTVLLKNIVARMRSHFNRHNDASILDPVKLLRKINHEVLATQSGKHVTAFAACLDMRSNSLRYAVAGHLPLPVMVANGDAWFLQGKGLPLGLFEDAEFQENHVELPTTFELCLFSDGVLEVLPEGSLDARERMLLELCREENGDIDGLVRRFGVSPDQPLPDDIAIMTVCRVAEANECSQEKS